MYLRASTHTRADVQAMCMLMAACIMHLGASELCAACRIITMADSSPGFVHRFAAQHRYMLRTPTPMCKRYACSWPRASCIWASKPCTIYFTDITACALTALRTVSPHKPIHEHAQICIAHSAFARRTDLPGSARTYLYQNAMHMRHWRSHIAANISTGG